MRNHQSPSWGSSLFGFIFFFLKYTAHRRGAGGWGERQREKQHEEREEEGKGGGEQYTAGENYLGEKGVVRGKKDTRNR